MHIQKVLADPGGVLVQPVSEIVQARPQSKLPWMAAAFAVGLVIAGVAVWNLRPALDAGQVIRFPFVLPDGQVFTTRPTTLVGLSPDGTRLAYNADNQLHLLNFNEMESRPIAGTEGGGRQSGVFSRWAVALLWRWWEFKDSKESARHRRNVGHVVGE